MACPHLREVVMLFCDACPVKKMLPLDRIATANPCLGDYQTCQLFQEVTADLVIADGVSSARVAALGRKAGPP
jgi:hypothetical protein